MIALLRGINVGKHNRIKMADLRAGFEQLGHTEVATHLQSGNVIFRPVDPGVSRPALSESLASMLLELFGISSPVILRTGEEIADALLRSPYADAEEDLALLHLLLLDRQPDAPKVASLDIDCGAPDRFSVQGGDIAVWYPNGSARSKLTIGFFEKALGVVGTARNHRTLLALVSKDVASAR